MVAMVEADSTGANIGDLISVCAVVRNNQALVGDFIRKTTSVLADHFAHYELLIIDNNSADATPKRIEELQRQIANVRLIRLSRPYPIETATISALDNAIGDYVITMDIEWDPPEMIPAMIDKAITEGYDILIVRHEARKKYTPFDRLASAIFYWSVRRIFGTSIRLDETQFRAFSRPVVNAVTRIRTKQRYLKYFNVFVGFKQGHLTYVGDDHQPPARAPINRLDRIAVGLDLIISNSAVPLRIASAIGLLASLLNLIYLVYVLITAIVKKDIVEGWITTNVVSTSMFFLLFLMLVILAEYIARLVQEVKHEPLYFIEYETSSTISTYSQVKDENKLNVASPESSEWS